jgi:tRNA-binding EMAP/Myf-like protein
MRKLASIQKIVKIEEIPNADRILKCTVLGWDIIIAKIDNFKVGDLVCYIEIDSILPDKPEFEFLRERKFRIKTIKLKGQVSQGIVFPLSVLPSDYLRRMGYAEGDNVTEILGVKKYDPQAEFERKETERLAGIDKNRMDKFLKRYAWYRRLIFHPIRTPMPSFIRKTDEDRIQLFPNACEEWKYITFDVTEKIDGQSATYFVVPNTKKGFFGRKWIFGVCSRNFQLLKPDNSSYWTIAKQHSLKVHMTEWCNHYKKGLIIQGEIIGSKIQGGKYGRAGFEFFVFNVIVYDKGNKEVYDQLQQMSFCSAYGLTTVPWIETNYRLPKTIQEIVECSKGISTLAGIYREGVVMRNYTNNISFKVVNPDFLLKYSE